VKGSLTAPKRGAVVLTLSVVAAVLVGQQARAEGEAPSKPRLFLRLAIGPAFNYESWSPQGGYAGASYTGWAPVLDVAIGRQVRPRLVLAGELQLAPVVNRTENAFGGSYPLTDTLHLVDSLGAILDYTPWRHPRLHFGGGAGVLVVTEMDTNSGSTATHLGFALSGHAGYRRHLAGAWSIGVMGRLTLYRFSSDTPAPPSSSLGLLPVLLLTFTR
jgi:hypothetical protein